MSINRVEGTSDLFGADMRALASFSDIAREVFRACGYEYAETPILEQTDLFVRGLGEASDVVNKEMYTALSGGNMTKLMSGEKVSSKSKLTLRPEGTAGLARAIVQNHLVEQYSQPGRFFYIGPMFRAERPQKGRMRQFYQAGAECIGSSDPFLDAQMIAMAQDFILKFCGMDTSQLNLELNSIGCEKCRSEYRKLLVEFEHSHTDSLCETCNERSNINPLRAFDCKKDGCKQVMNQAPKITEHLCSDCASHFEQVKELLTKLGVKYMINPMLVRGLDYYTRTVFEFSAISGLGSQNALCGGGRYDKLIEELGGKSLPALGFAAGFERMKLAAESCGRKFSKNKKPLYFIVTLCEEARNIARDLIIESANLDCARMEMDYRDSEDPNALARSAKSQFKLADKLDANYVIAIGEDELTTNEVLIRDMTTHSEQNATLEDVIDHIKHSKGE